MSQSIYRQLIRVAVYLPSLISGLTCNIDIDCTSELEQSSIVYVVKAS